MAARQNLQVGKDVDFYRQPANKDVPGWFGPAAVIDVPRATRGIISAAWNAKVMEVQLPSLRRRLHFWPYS
eukprot:7460814-Lingulodinium_polyedra.AAC.1